MKLVLLDWVILLLLVGSVVWGYKNGLIRQVFQLFGMIIAYMVAFFFYDDFAILLKKFIPFPKNTDASTFNYVTGVFQLENMFYTALAFAVLFFITRWSLLYLSKVLHLVSTLPVLNLTNRFSGAILGLGTTFFILLILVNLFYFMPSPKIHKEMNRSNMVHILIEKTPYFSEHFQKLWKKGIEKMDWGKEDI